MTCRGHVKNGVVVLDEPVSLPDGARVEVSILPFTQEPQIDDSSEAGKQRLLRFAGKFTGLPEDAATNLDRYLYGQPHE